MTEYYGADEAGLPDYGPYELKRSWFFWLVRRPNYWTGGYQYPLKHHFIRKDRAIARLVQLKLEGNDVIL